jgi:hypothetical protein
MRVIYGAGALTRARQSTCGVAVVQDYYKRAKFNVIELAQAAAGEKGDAGGAAPAAAEAETVADMPE